MNRTLAAFAIAFAATVSASATSVTFTFEDNDFDETFNVFFEASVGDDYGLATYNVALMDLDATPLDPATFDWEEGVLSNAGGTLGFTLGLLESAIGTDAFSATNSQFMQNRIFGVGQTPIFVDGLPQGSADIDLGVPAFLGTLTIPGAGALSNGELFPLFTPNAALFDDSRSGVGVPGAVNVVLLRIPEPTTAVLAVLALVALGSRRRV